MKIAIFGATGRTGIPLMEQALAAGHEVVALVRDPAKVPANLAANPHLTLITGDVMNPPDVDRAVEGADAVISVLGRSKNSPPQMHTVATGHIVASMEKYEVKRLVSLSGAGVAAPQDRPKLANRLISLALKALSGDVLQDAIGHAEVITHSPLDWVIVRGPMLRDGSHTGQYKVGWVGVNTSTSITRADVADFLLKQTTDNTYLRQMPMISN
jgi:putative NADH-flavin reductase